MIELHTLPLGSIVESNFNPRKYFNPAKLAELVDSIKTSGVLQPIMVRPLPGARVAETQRGVQYEIVAGAQRFRAAQQAGLPSIPALLCHLSDNAALEAAILENLQRDDLTELEEAEGFETLRQTTGLSVDEVAAKIGKSRSYVFARLKLLDMSVDCKTALRDGHIDASRGLMLARIPDTALQTKALAEAMRTDFRGEVPSVRAFGAWLQMNVMLRLEAAPFAMADSQLLPSAGSCHVCPKRTGANPDLFADVKAADICTDPTCYRAKEEAHRSSVLATAAKRGMRLIDGEEAAEICHQYHNQLAGYSPLSQERNDTPDGQAASLGQLLGADAPDAVLIENPWTKELIAAVPTAEAEALLLARGLVKATQADKGVSKTDVEGDIKRLQERAKKATTKLFRQMAFDELAGAVHGYSGERTRDMLSPQLLRAWWLRAVEDQLPNADAARVFGLDLVKSEDYKTVREHQDAQETQIRLHIQACSQDKLYKALALYMVLEDHVTFFYDDTPEPTLYTALASELGIDLDDIEAQATAQVRADTAEELRKLKAQLKPAKANDISATGYRGPNGETWSGRGLMPRWLTVLVKDGQDKESFRITPPAPAQPPKVPTTGAPAAQAMGGGGEVPKAKAKAKKPKTTAAEAQAQIAAALTAQEQAQEGTNPGADAQGAVGDSSQPVAAVVADAPKASQAVAAPVWGELAAEFSDAEFADAKRVVYEHEKCSISLVQRRLKIGFNRAAMMIERMEAEGMVGIADHAGQRAILKGEA